MLADIRTTAKLLYLKAEELGGTLQGSYDPGTLQKILDVTLNRWVDREGSGETHDGPDKLIFDDAVSWLVERGYATCGPKGTGVFILQLTTECRPPEAEYDGLAPWEDLYGPHQTALAPSIEKFLQKVLAPPTTREPQEV